MWEIDNYIEKSLWNLKCDIEKEFANFLTNEFGIDKEENTKKSETSCTKLSQSISESNESGSYKIATTDVDNNTVTGTFEFKYTDEDTLSDAYANFMNALEEQILSSFGYIMSDEEEHEECDCKKDECKCHKKEEKEPEYYVGSGSVMPDKEKKESVLSDKEKKEKNESKELMEFTINGKKFTISYS